MSDFLQKLPTFLGNHVALAALFVILLVAFVVFTVVAAFMKLQHAPMAEFFLNSALSLIGIFIVFCIVDVIRTKKLNTTEKWMYVLLVIFFPLLGGILYVLQTREKQFYKRLDG